MKNKFQNLIKEDLYQAFLFTSPAHIPLSFWTHPWIVINKKEYFRVLRFVTKLTVLCQNLDIFI